MQSPYTSINVASNRHKYNGFWRVWIVYTVLLLLPCRLPPLFSVVIARSGDLVEERIASEYVFARLSCATFSRLIQREKGTKGAVGEECAREEGILYALSLLGYLAFRYMCYGRVG